MKNKSIIDLIPHLDDGGYYFVEPIEPSDETPSGIILASVKHQSIHLRDMHPRTGKILAYRDNPLKLDIGAEIMPNCPTTKPFNAPKEFFVKLVDGKWELANETEWILEDKIFSNEMTFIKEKVKKVWPVHCSEIICVCD